LTLKLSEANNILDLAKLDAGKFELREADVSLLIVIGQRHGWSRKCLLLRP
jgi:hypothetical protein